MLSLNWDQSGSSLGSNTAHWIPLYTLTRSMIAVRRTGMYRHCGSDDTVRAPNETTPAAGNRRITSTPSGFRVPCSTSLSSTASPTTPFRLASTPAGAFQTPRVASMRAYSPARYPDGGSRIGSWDTPVGSSALTHGKYSAP